MDKIKVVGPYIMVKPETKEERVTNSGIILTGGDAKIPETYAEVKALGTGVVLPNGTQTTFTVSVGDTVVFKSYSGDIVNIDGEQYIFVLESDILAILQNGKKNQDKKGK